MFKGGRTGSALRDDLEPVAVGIFNEVDAHEMMEYFRLDHEPQQKELIQMIVFHHFMGIYFIEDPDGYWLEIIPQR